MASPVLGGRYELRRRLAQGDSASVYLALDRRGDRQVAVKLLNPGAGADATFGERLRREAPAVAALAAPGIVKVYDWGRAGERHFVVMEYIAGRSLAELIATRGPLGAKVATRVAAEVANALAAAHRAGIVHRNIKPQNVLLSDDAQVKVTDFVMAAPQDLDASGRPAPSGSAAYISPEQARGQPTDGRGDLYALGILLYEMLSGSPPPRGEVRTLGADVPAELGAIVARLVAQAPAHRYQSAEEAVGALQAVHDRLRAQPAPRQDAPAQPEPRSPLPPPPATPRRPVSGPPRRQAPQSGAPPGARPGAPRGVAQRRGGRSAAARRPPGYGTRPRSAGGTGRDGFERIERQRRSGLFFVGFAVLLVVLLIMIVVLVKVLNPDDDTATDPIATIAVPSVYQLTEDVAVRTLESNGFAVVTVRAANAEIPAGHVFEQQPRAGTKLASGSAITLTVSAGASAVPVPNVLGWQAIDAERALRAAGFTANLVQVGSDRPAGEVLQQEPAPLVAHDTGTAVTLNISAGPSAILIPNVAGMDEVDAAVSITGAGLVVIRQVEPSEVAPEGTVTRTEPAAGSQLAEGSQVFVYVSSGPAVLAMPDLIGLNPTTALIQLDTLGVTAQVVPVAPLPGEASNIIVSQDPAAGTAITPGSLISLFVTGESAPGGEGGVPAGGDGQGNPEQLLPVEGNSNPSGLPGRPAQ